MPPPNLTELLAFLRRDPDNDRLRAAVFEAALAAGQFDEAQFQVTHARRVKPQDLAWRHRDGILALARNDFAAAAPIFASLIEEGHDQPAIRYNLAFARSGQGDRDDAAALAAPLRAEPGETGDLAWILWLRCRHHQGALSDALAALEAAQAVRLLPGAVWGVASLIALDLERIAAARSWSERALASDPRQLEALVTQATLALAGPEPDQALAWFERALAVSPADGRSWSGLAFTRLRLRHFEAAAEAFRKAVAGMPSHIGTWIGSGWAELYAGRPEAARAAFEQAVALDRNVADSHGSLAVALARLGRRDAAAAEIERALGLDPRGLAALYARGVLKGDADDPETAQKLFRRLLAGRKLGIGRPSTQVM